MARITRTPRRGRVRVSGHASQRRLGRMTEGRIQDDDLDDSMTVDTDGRQGTRLDPKGGIKLGPNGLMLGGGAEITELVDTTSGRQSDGVKAMADSPAASTSVALLQADYNAMLVTLRDNLATLATKVNQITTFLGD